jgi:hypothetical protein
VHALENDFKSWCGDLGYDDDSIKVRKIYDACQECGFKLKRLGFKLARLRDLFSEAEF